MHFKVAHRCSFLRAQNNWFCLLLFNPLTAAGALRAEFTLSNAKRFYSVRERVNSVKNALIKDFLS